MTIYTEQVNEHPVGCTCRELASHVTTNSFWCLTDLHNKCFGEEAKEFSFAEIHMQNLFPVSWYLCRSNNPLTQECTPV